MDNIETVKFLKEVRQTKVTENLGQALDLLCKFFENKITISNFLKDSQGRESEVVYFLNRIYNMKPIGSKVFFVPIPLNKEFQIIEKPCILSGIVESHLWNCEKIILGDDKYILFNNSKYCYVEGPFGKISNGTELRPTDYAFILSKFPNLMPNLNRFLNNDYFSHNKQSYTYDDAKKVFDKWFLNILQSDLDATDKKLPFLMEIAPELMDNIKFLPEKFYFDVKDIKYKNYTKFSNFEKQA